MLDFETLYRATHERIYYYVSQSVTNHEDAEELTADIFVKAAHRAGYERGPKVMQFWLLQVARTTLADYWRARPRVAIHSLDALLDAGWDGVAEALASGSDTLGVRVQRLLSALPQRYRDVLTCRFGDRLSIRETAYRLDVTEANVKVLQWRALKRAAALASGEFRRGEAQALTDKTRNEQ